MKHLIFCSERLQLTPFNSDDVQQFYDLNTDTFIRKFMWDDEVISLDTAQEIIIQNEKHFEESQFGIWKIALLATKDVVGYTGLWYFFDEPQPQLIYALLEPYTGQGLATEAAQLIIEYVFKSLEFSYLIAATDEPHQASQKVAERLGMDYLEKRIENKKPTIFYKLENY